VVVPVPVDDIVEFVTAALRPMRSATVRSLTSAGGVVVEDYIIELTLTFAAVDELNTRIDIESARQTLFQAFFQTRLGGTYRFRLALEEEAARRRG
jgi:hypothetical protein